MLRRRGLRTGTPADFLFVGLRNPGSKYEGTRHNVGAEVIEVLAGRHGARLRTGKEMSAVDEVVVSSMRLALAMPTTFMNESGQAVAKLVRRHGISDLERLVVIHDELDLEVGRRKVKLGGGLAGHNGLKSIRNHLHSPDFGRIRIGIGKPPGRQSTADFVLRVPGRADRAELDVVVQECADAAERIAFDGYETAMNQYNS